MVRWVTYAAVKATGASPSKNVWNFISTSPISVHGVLLSIRITILTNQLFDMSGFTQNTEIVRLTNSMKQSTSSKHKGRKGGQEIFRLLWNPKFHQCVQNNPPLVPILSQMNSVHISLIFILISSSQLSLRLPSVLLPLYFPTKSMYAFLTFQWMLHARQSITLYLITVVILCGEYKWWSFALYNFLQTPVTSFLLNSNILLSTLFSHTFKRILPLVQEAKFYIHTKKKKGKIIFSYILIVIFLHMKNSEFNLISS
jgi:hypothetical protein